MVEDLEGIAEGVRSGIRGGGLAVQVHEVAAHGGRGEVAVPDQVVPVVVAELRRVLLEGADQVDAVAVRHPGFGEAAAKVVRLAEGRIGRPAAADGPGEAVQALDPVVRCEGGVVGDVVDGPRIGVEGRDVRAHARAQQPGPDREVLVRRRLAGRGLHHSRLVHREPADERIRHP